MASVKLADTDNDGTEALQQEINSILIQIRATARHIEKITRENSVLRQEIIEMRQQLVQQIATQPV